MVERQLAVFAAEHAGLIQECDQAEHAYNRASREEAEERYGVYIELVEAGTEALAELRDNYAAALASDLVDEYENTFNRTVLKRFPRFALELEDR